MIIDFIREYDAYLVASLAILACVTVVAGTAAVSLLAWMFGVK
ncbi:hypothetical protein [Morganella phage Mecenats66]|nr:hypothetical protein [Morganella phage Mecenats66]